MRQILLIFALITSVTACAGTASKPTPPGIVGVWKLSGPRPTPGALPETLTWNFKNDGTIDYTFLPAEDPYANLSAWAGIKRKLRTYSGSARYKILDSRHLRMISGGSAGEFEYDVNGNELVLSQNIIVTGITGAVTGKIQHVYTRQQ